MKSGNFSRVCVSVANSVSVFLGTQWIFTFRKLSWIIFLDVSLFYFFWFSYLATLIMSMRGLHCLPLHIIFSLIFKTSCSFLFHLFIEEWFRNYKIHPLKYYSLVVFNILIRLYYHYHHFTPEFHFILHAFLSWFLCPLVLSNVPLKHMMSVCPVI